MPEFIRNYPWITVILAYLAIISLISIIVCIYDKKISKKNRVELRIPEKTLLMLSFFGGALGGSLAMSLFRHKTKHWYFVAINAVGLLWQVGAVIALVILL